ncbi:hypothetical protein PQR57_41835 [Paraburkholderia dipogonis]|uniref:DUF4397 domain-containing protein n=1 Tax=Paraburkholderia dipogonis TaxID=1211383 RepID=A0ABW9B3K3_9BURK
MKAILLLVILVISPCFAAPVDPTEFFGPGIGFINDPSSHALLQVSLGDLPPALDPNMQGGKSIRVLHWVALPDERNIVIYPGSSGRLRIDQDHFHHAGHISSNQIHIVGGNPADVNSSLRYGVVYTVEGSLPDNYDSRITEKIDILSRSEMAIGLLMTGLGAKPDPVLYPNPEVFDLKSSYFRGTTVAYITMCSIVLLAPCPPVPGADAAYGSLILFPVVSFTGFNPVYNRYVLLPPHTTLTIITELRIGHGPRREQAIFPGF